MALSKWSNIPSVMDVKLSGVPYVVLCELDGYTTSKTGTYPIIGYGQSISIEPVGSIYKISGILTTEYEQAVPFVVIGRRKPEGTIRTRLIVPVFDYDNWSIALGNPNIDAHLEYSAVLGAIQQNPTLGLTRVKA